MNSSILFGALVVLSQMLTACSKPSQEPEVARAIVHNLGIVEVSDGVESRHDLGSGKVCIVNPAIQQDGSILLAMSVEESGEVLAKPRVVTRAGVGFEISIGGVGIAMVPQIKK